MKHKKRNIKKIIWITLSIVVILLGLTTAIIGNYLVDFALVNQPGKDVTPSAETNKADDENSAIIDANKAIEDQLIQQWENEVTIDTVDITSHDGLNLVADQILYPDSHQWVILVHGYQADRTMMCGFATQYYDRGFNILMPDLRSHGDSEGEYIGMGWLDRLDLLQWIDHVISLDEDASIVLHGISMGAATVMMTSGETMPSNVKTIIEDCGYTSVWDIFSDELSALFGLPEFPVLYMADLVATLRVGYEFKQASALEQVKKSTVPMLFIHGSDDRFVFTDMLEPLYQACPNEKEKLLIEGAGHGEARLKDPNLYYDTVFEFIDRYL